MQALGLKNTKLIALSAIVAAALTYVVMTTTVEPVEAISIGQGKCATGVISSTSPEGSKVMTGLATTINNGDVSRRVIAQLSADGNVDPGGEIRVSYSVDGGAPQENVYGPANFANNQEFSEARAAMAIIPLGPGTHTVRPFWRVSGVSGKLAQLEERCFTVEGRTS